MKVLVACEESQAVTIELRKLGHEAYSCDILPCSGGHPEWHLQKDITGVLKEKWDMIIAFPPCTYLTVTGNRWFNIEKYGDKAIKRHEDRKEAVKFFMMFANADCEKIAIENPIGIMSTEHKKPTQVINPYQFGHDASKKTCLWLKGLPKLEPSGYIKPRIANGMKRWGNQMDCGNNITKNNDGKILAWGTDDIMKVRSKTYPGIAKAIAIQWTK